MLKTYEKPGGQALQHRRCELIEMDDGTARISSVRRGLVRPEEIEYPFLLDPEGEEKPPSDTDDLTREVIAELVETLRELIHHWWNDSWAPTPNQKSPVVTTPQEAYYRAHALYRRHKHLLEEETDEPTDL